jgi:hypothetical protein
LIKFFFPPRYPNGFDIGTPEDYFTKQDAQGAITNPMQGKSSNSVNVKYLDKDKIISQLRCVCKKIKQDKNVQKIFLFGSFVRGDFLPAVTLIFVLSLKKTINGSLIAFHNI